MKLYERYLYTEKTKYPNLKPFDKRIAFIIYDEYNLPYSIDYIVKEIKSKHGIEPNVIYKSIKRLESNGIISVKSNNVFTSGGDDIKTWLGIRR
jgi:DNA-binding MarR family transcriptional regulator